MSQSRRFLVVNVVPPRMPMTEVNKDLTELKSLVHTYGGGIIVRIIQRRATPDTHTYIGSGKTQEVADTVSKESIDVVLVNAVVKQTQLFNLEKTLWDKHPTIQIWDRVDLILHIFSKHARTAEAKLQIELARMRHMGPKVYGLGKILSRQGGGIGTRGIGETNIERMKRHWRDEIKRTQEKLNKLVANRQKQIHTRRQNGLHTVSIVGYTNAGKSTLFTRLSNKQVKAQNALFATLDSTIGRLYLPSLGKEVLVSDTIGFIQNLPTKLIDAFKSTLLESMHASLLLHVIDISDPLVDEKIQIVQHILSEIQIQETPCIFVFNKIDESHTASITDLRTQYAQYHPQFVSAHTGDGLTGLRYAMEEIFTTQKMSRANL